MRRLTKLDYIKLGLLVPLFFGVAPGLGFWLKNRPKWQLAVFAVMAFMTIEGLFGPGNWAKTLHSIAHYRGHTKGYAFYYNLVLAIALIIAKRREDPKSFRWVPPGLGWYLGYVGVSMISIVNAANTNYVLMAAQKMLTLALVMIATFNTLRTEDDLKFFVRVMAWTMAWELFVCLKLKYLGHVYQVRGTFEHQNALAMYANLISMSFLAVALGPRIKGSRLALFGFLACGVIVECTLSRAGLLMFALGTVGTTGLSVFEKITARRLLLTFGMGLCGSVALILSMGTIIARFHDRGNKASGELRHVMIHACREMVRDHFFGIGWNNYALEVNEPYRYANVYYDWERSRHMKVDYTARNATVESQYYLLLAETGYPGLAGWLTVILVALWRNGRAFFFFGHSFRRCLSLGIFMGCSLNYVHSTLERVLVQPRNLMLWLILLGVTARMEVMRREAQQALPPATPPTSA